MPKVLKYWERAKRHAFAVAPRLRDVMGSNRNNELKYDYLIDFLSQAYRLGYERRRREDQKGPR